MVKIVYHPKISILLPTHNRADVISYAIESALYQTEKNFELLIVGDGCTDHTNEIVASYLQDDRIKWFDFSKGKFFGYDNRNTVLKQAKGEYIAFLAHDDILTSDHIEILSKHLDHHQQTDLVYSRSCWIDDNGLMFPSVTNLHDNSSLDNFFDLGNTIPASCFMHRRSIFEKIGYWNENLERASDWDFWKRIINREKSNYLFEPTPTVFHFKAKWKANNLIWPYDLNTIVQYLRSNDTKILGPLMLNIHHRKSPQQALWEEIQQDNDFTKNSRQSISTLLDHIAYHNFSKLIFEKDHKDHLYHASIQPKKVDSILKKIGRIFKKWTL